MNAPHTLRTPLNGIRVVEFEGLGPGPLAAMMLADMGAEVIVLTRAEQAAGAQLLGGAARNPRLSQAMVLLCSQPRHGKAARRCKASSPVRLTRRTFRMGLV